MTFSLNDLQPEQFAIIKEHLSIAAVRQRFLDFGLLPGSKVQFIRSAPLGDPIEIKVGRGRISLRRLEAATILVEKL